MALNSFIVGLNNTELENKVSYTNPLSLREAIDNAVTAWEHIRNRHIRLSGGIHANYGNECIHCGRPGHFYYDCPHKMTPDTVEVNPSGIEEIPIFTSKTIESLVETKITVNNNEHIFHIIPSNFPVKQYGILGAEFLKLEHTILSFLSNSLTTRNNVNLQFKDVETFTQQIPNPLHETVVLTINVDNNFIPIVTMQSGQQTQRKFLVDSGAKVNLIKSKAMLLNINEQLSSDTDDSTTSEIFEPYIPPKPNITEQNIQIDDHISSNNIVSDDSFTHNIIKTKVGIHSNVANNDTDRLVTEDYYQDRDQKTHAINATIDTNNDISGITPNHLSWENLELSNIVDNPIRCKSNHISNILANFKYSNRRT
ncbi:hypothetical protein ANTRET_LOCUS9428 [Anthophora retusa]